MNREEAQFILAAYRPNTEDARDPQFREALELAGRDPVLGRWFAEQQAIDLAFSAKVRGRGVPADLRVQLLLARTTERRTVAWWRRPRWLALAASLAIGSVAAGWWLRPAPGTEEWARFRTAMAAAAGDMDGHADVWGLDQAGYRTWLKEKQGAHDFALPTRLADQNISACKIVSWEGRKVTMLCYKFGDQHVDVFVIDAAKLPGIELSATPRFHADADLATAAWRQGGKVYLLAGAMTRDALARLL